MKIGFTVDYNSFKYRVGMKPEGGRSTKIERCPMCGKKGLHVQFQSGPVTGQYEHVKVFKGWAWEITEFCLERDNKGK